ncbi:MAG: lysophospholipid acyltransferase family protein [Verrucomicrobiota bacterium]|jgi:1-acyl-sn-glycerol-3-phosphate acyltransferase
MTASFLAWVARILTGARARWQGCAPVADQRVYFANHTSNLDFVLLWASLPDDLRRRTRPVAGRDYWKGGLREWLASRVFRAVLIERRTVTRDSNPLTPMLDTLRGGESLIIFPEGTRNPDGEVNPFRPGLFHIAKALPEIQLVPVFIENLNRVLPKGEILPVPMLCSVTFGEPLRLAQGEMKPDFLTRARDAMLALRPK